jgi:hypothetical protein
MFAIDTDSYCFEKSRYRTSTVAKTALHELSAACPHFLNLSFAPWKKPSLEPRPSNTLYGIIDRIENPHISHFEKSSGRLLSFPLAPDRHIYLLALLVLVHNEAPIEPLFICQSTKFFFLL